MTDTHDLVSPITGLIGLPREQPSSTRSCGPSSAPNLISLACGPIAGSRSR